MQQKFLNRVLDELLHDETNLQDYVFVVPSRRAATFFKSCISKKIKRTIFAPEIYSIEYFIEHISGLHYATSTEQLFALYQSYLELEVENNESFLEFSKWARTLLLDFDEIDRYLIPHKKIFSYLAAITEVNHWYLQKERTPMMQEYIAFWNKLEPLYTKYKEVLLQDGRGHQGLLYRIAADKVEDYLENNKGKKHVFIGFNALNNAESHIIQKILASGEAEIFWDLDQYFLDEAYHDAGYFIRQHLNQWEYFRNHSIKGLNNDYLAPKQFEITGVPKHVSQVKYIGQIIKNKLSENPGSLENTALVLADESLLNPLLNALPEELKNANITMGYPLKNTPIAAFFTQFIELYLRDDTAGWYYKTVLSFIDQPFVQLVLSERESEAFSNFKSLVHQKNLIYLTRKSLLSIKGEIWQHLFCEENKEVGHFLDSCITLVHLIRNKLEEKEGVSLELEYLYSLYTLFNQLKELITTYSFLSDIPTLYGIYNELLHQETIDFQGEPMQGLQIMGMLESRVLDFDTVIISSVNEGIIPSGKQGNSFIPYDVKKELGLPTYKEKDAVYTYHFYRLLQRAKNIHLTYNTEADVLEGGEPSRLIHQLLADKNTAAYINQKLASMKIEVDPPEPISIQKNSTLMAAIENHASTGFSPTSLTQYIRNPVEFYKRSILRIEESEDVEESIAARTFGIIIHEVLEELYQPFLGEYLEASSLKSLRSDIEFKVRHHFLRFYEESSLTRGKNSIAFKVLVRYVENFLDTEIRQLKQNKIKLLALEKQLTANIDVVGVPYPVKLKGKLDRVDEVNGKLRILDYKTGRVTVAEMNVVDWNKLIQETQLNKAFQVLCYAFMYNSSEGIYDLDAGVISFKNMKQGFISFAIKEKPRSRKRIPGINPEILELFNQQLHLLIQEICNPEIPFTEKV